MHKYFTQKRIDGFKSSAEDSTYLDKYIENIRISMQVYPLLHVFEISLRNRIDEFLVNNICPDWTIDILEYHTGQIKIPHDMENKIYQVYNRIFKTDISRNKNTKLYPKANPFRPIKHDEIISNLTLGFWISFFQYYVLSKNNVQIREFMQAIFKERDARKLDLENTFKDLNKIREFRNRVFHYEPILNHHLYNHKQMIQILRQYLKKLEHNKGELKIFCDKFI